MELREYLPPNWKLSTGLNGLRLQAPSQKAADEFLDGAIAHLVNSANNIKGIIEIAWEGCKRPYRISPELLKLRCTKVACSTNETLSSSMAISPSVNSTPPESSLIFPELELDFNAIYQKLNPVYITQLSDQTNLFANPAALAAQGKKPKDFLGQSACALNDEEELAKRCSRIYNDGYLTEYEYSALRWFQDPETGFWRRKRMNFTSNFRKVEYLGELCWLGEVLQAIDTGKVVG